MQNGDANRHIGITPWIYRAVVRKCCFRKTSQDPQIFSECAVRVPTRRAHRLYKGLAIDWVF